MTEVQININLSSYNKAIINNNAKLFMKFDSLPLIEEISGQSLNINNDQPPFIESSDFGNALRMRPRSSISFPLLLSSPIEFSIGFWLRPYWIAPTISPITSLPVYYRMSLIDKSNYTFNSATGFINASNATFCIFEECKENNYNIMKILLQDPDGNQVTISTEQYLANKFHHFWITYYGPSKRFEVYIDGLNVSLFSDDGSAVPSSLNNSSITEFHINQSAVGYSSLVRNNAGLIDEFVFINKLIADSNSIAKVINLGVEYIIDNSLNYMEIVDNCFAFDDPTALGVTSVFSNGKNFYAGRNDGSLFKGDRIMWQARRDFSNSDELKFIKYNILSTDSIIRIENGALGIYKASVRI